MSQDTNINNLIINKLTKAQFESIQTPDPTQMYLITDDNGLSSLDDVSLNNVTDGQVLKYNETTQMWENSTLNFLKNNSSAIQALVIGDNAEGYNYGSSGADVVIGSDATNLLGGEANVLVGADAYALNATHSVAIGCNAHCTNNYTIQIGDGTNNIANSVQFFNYQMLDGSGIIPDARLSTNIARTSAIPTATSDLTNDSGFITGITSSNVITALGYTPADNTLSNVSSIDANSAVKTALDTKVNTSDIWYDSSVRTLFIGVSP